MLRGLRKRHDKADFATRRMLVESLVARITVSGRRDDEALVPDVEVVYRFPAVTPTRDRSRARSSIG